MLACIDSYYHDQAVTTAVVLFRAWTDKAAADSIVRRDAVVGGAEDYVAGQFYKRELPFILAALESLGGPPETLIVDSYVWLNAEGKEGMGAILYERLGAMTPVIGVAKNKMVGSAGIEVLRGGSTRPLYVTAAGIDQDTAAEHIHSMHGPYREPTLLKLADRLSRGS